MGLTAAGGQQHGCHQRREQGCSHSLGHAASRRSVWRRHHRDLAVCVSMKRVWQGLRARAVAGGSENSDTETGESSRDGNTCLAFFE
ncbi:hypothetical protein A176_004837 [Myxococcus hansupus]|uniref:Uncharacterized protein n=1 Tax=Pseudomyxococcus hansupus TaxID=1297742 RepID=A0A0H4X2Q2_9BACT|nr:hypothetical protein A176_004837 [Myxococcus hansupus]